MLLAGGLGQQGMGSAAGAVAGYGGRLCGQGAAEYPAGGARAAVINDRELRSECGEYLVEPEHAHLLAPFANPNPL